MEYFKTSDYGLATWLVYRRTTLTGAVEYSGDTRKRFIFVRNDNTNQDIEDWNASDDDEVIMCKKFFKAHNTVKHALRESISAE